MRIKNIEELATAAKLKRAVVIPDVHPWRKPKPASVILHLPGAIILNLLRQGVYLYTKPGRNDHGRNKKQ